MTTFNLPGTESIPEKEQPKEELSQDEVTEDLDPVDESLSDNDGVVSDSIDDEYEEYDDDDAFKALADVAPETEIWTGGPTAGQMLKWMEQHKGGVYVTSISFDEHIAWRPLLRREYGQISAHLESLGQEISEIETNMINEELICRTCVLAPDFSNQDFDLLLAGIPTLISQNILERSGFTAIGLREMM